MALLWLAALLGPTMAGTLDTVRARGHLVCGASETLPGFAQFEDNAWSGFDVDFCRAVAAAVFGDATKVEFRALRGESRFAALQTGAVDLLARNAPWTMRRDSGYAAGYVATSFFDGQGFMVPESLGVVSAYELDKISVCVVDGGDDLARLREFFFENQAAYTEVLYEDLEDLGVAYRSGLCNAVSAPARWLHAIRRSLPEPATHRILPERISKDALGPLVRLGDDQWFNIVRWTLFALIDADELGINASNAETMQAARSHAVQAFLGREGDLGASLGLKPDFMVDVVRAVGNYGDMYDRAFGPETGAALPRGQNSLWSNGGLLFAPSIR